MVDRPEAQPYPVLMWCEARTPGALVEEEGFADEVGFDADLRFPDDDPVGAPAATADDAEGPLEDLDADDFDLPDEGGQAAWEGDDALGPAEPDDADLDADLDASLADEAPSLGLADDAEGPLQDEDTELAHEDQEDAPSRLLGGDEEGVAADDAAFEFVPDLPPLGAGFDGEALFDEALADLDLTPEAGAPPPPLVPPTRVPPSGVADRSPPTT